MEDKTNEREAFYDAEIAPKLAELSRLCQQRGLSFLAVVEYERDDAGNSGFGRTLATVPNTSSAFRWFDAFVRCNANFDRYCMAFTSHVVRERVPHTSMYMKLLGIDPDPAKR